MSKIQNPVLQRLESQTGEKWERAVNDVTTGTPLTITLQIPARKHSGAVAVKRRYSIRKSINAR